MNPFIAVNTHLRKWFPSSDLKVLFPLSASDFGIEVTLIKPGKGRDYITLITNGLSATRSMELCILLPSAVNLAVCDTGNPELTWAFNLLVTIGAIVKKVTGKLDMAITMSPLIEFTNFAGFILVEPTSLPKGFEPIQDMGRQIEVSAILPLYTEELAYLIGHTVVSKKQDFSSWAFAPEKLETLLVKNGLGDIVDRHRKNTSLPGKK